MKVYIQGPASANLLSAQLPVQHVQSLQVQGQERLSTPRLATWPPAPWADQCGETARRQSEAKLKVLKCHLLGAANLLPASQKCLLARPNSTLEPSLKACVGVAREQRVVPYSLARESTRRRGSSVWCQLPPCSPTLAPSSAWKGQFPVHNQGHCLSGWKVKKDQG